jgi:hypothetical protein
MSDLDSHKQFKCGKFLRWKDSALTARQKWSITWGQGKEFRWHLILIWFVPPTASLAHESKITPHLVRIA